MVHFEGVCIIARRILCMEFTLVILIMLTFTTSRRQGTPGFRNSCESFHKMQNEEIFKQKARVEKRAPRGFGTHLSMNR